MTKKPVALNDPGTPVADLSPADVQALLARYQLKKLQEEEANENRRLDQEARSQLEMLRIHEQEMAQRESDKRACGGRGHTRENGTVAIGGQRDGGFNLQTFCLRCGQTWTGVGDGPGQLPNHLFQGLDQENIGG